MPPPSATFALPQNTKTGNEPFQLSPNAALKVAFQGSRVASDGGLTLVRELDERLLTPLGVELQRVFITLDPA